MVPGGPQHLRHGAGAEAVAAGYLAGQGLEAVARNFRSRFGELDLVMIHGQVLVVVEVRSRRNPAWVSPAATVNRGKQRRIVGATRYFLLRQPRFAGWPVRFDVVEVTGDLSSAGVRWYRAAFSLDDVAGG